MNILIIDDERQLVFALSSILKQNNYSVDGVFDGETGLEYALSNIYDLIILDVMLPKLDGFSLLNALRSKKIETPILMLTAKSEVADKINGLNSGADDYLTKPFSTEELLARIKALLRRKESFTGNHLSYNDIILDRDSYKLIKGEAKIDLGKKEFQILELLMLSPTSCIERERLIEKIWGFDSEAEYNTIEVYISFIRRKLSAIGSTTEIRSIRGVGYTLGAQK